MISDPALAAQLLLTLSGALIGAVLGGLVSWGSQRRERRLKLTLDLYSEFHSPVFNHLRIVAHGALADKGSMPAAYAAALGEQKDAIASIVHFWEKVALLMREGALEPRMVRRFFGQYARWWSQLLCERDVGLKDPEWGQTLGDVNWLFDRLIRSKREGARR